MSKFYIPRRTFLKGAGAAILLPMLDVMVGPRASAAVNPGTPRFATFYMSLGVFGEGVDLTKTGYGRYFRADPGTPMAMSGWRPASAGALPATLPLHLQSFQSLKNKISTISGLSLMPGVAENKDLNHSAAVTAWASPAWQSAAEALGKNNTPPDSIDQFIANAFGVTPGSTIAFNPSPHDGTEPEGGHHGYISHNSKLGGNHMVPKVGDPLKVFNQLFGNCKPSVTNQGALNDEKSILDAVMDSTKQLQKKLGKDDINRIEAYFQNIREVELSLKPLVGMCPTAPVYNPALNGGPLDWLGIMRMMVDVTALAMASDAMPIASIMTDVEANGNSGYANRVQAGSDFVGVNGQKVNFHKTLDIHFDITHGADAQLGDPNTRDGFLRAIEEWNAYSRMNMLLLKRLADRLDQMPAEPNGNTPLDNSLILAGSCYSSAHHHNVHNLPVLLIGGKSAKMRQGQNIVFPHKTHLGRLHLSIAKALGVNTNNYHGHTSVLPGIFD